MAIGLNDTLRVTASFLKDGINTVQNVFTVFVDNVVPIFSQSDVHADIREWVRDIEVANVGQMAAGIATDFVQIYNITQDVLEFVGPWFSNFSGGGGGDALPNGTSPFAFARTAVKRKRGSKFFPAVSESHQANGIISSFVATALATAVNDWIQPFTGGTSGNDYRGVLVLSPPAQPPTVADFTNAVVRTQMGYQRRRKPGVGA